MSGSVTSSTGWRGIAVVERVDEDEAVVVLGKRVVFTIARQDIVLEPSQPALGMQALPIGSVGSVI